MRRLPIPSTQCERCGKRAQTSFWRSHSHHRVKRLVKPNLISHKGVIYCTACWKTLKREHTNQKTG